MRLLLLAIGLMAVASATESHNTTVFGEAHLLDASLWRLASRNSSTASSNSADSNNTEWVSNVGQRLKRLNVSHPQCFTAFDRRVDEGLEALDPDAKEFLTRIADNVSLVVSRAEACLASSNYTCRVGYENQGVEWTVFRQYHALSESAKRSLNTTFPATMRIAHNRFVRGLFVSSFLWLVPGTNRSELVDDEENAGIMRRFGSLYAEIRKGRALIESLQSGSSANNDTSQSLDQGPEWMAKLLAAGGVSGAGIEELTSEAKTLINETAAATMRQCQQLSGCQGLHELGAVTRDQVREGVKRYREMNESGKASLRATFPAFMDLASDTSVHELMGLLLGMRAVGEQSESEVAEDSFLGSDKPFGKSACGEGN